MCFRVISPQRHRGAQSLHREILFFVQVIRIIVAPHEYPTPNPVSNARSPTLSRPIFRALSMAMGIVAETVFPDSFISTQYFSTGILSLARSRSNMNLLA